MSAARRLPSPKLVASVRRDIASFRETANRTHAPEDAPIRSLIADLENTLASDSVRRREIEAKAAAMFRDDVVGTWMSGTDWRRLDGSLREAYVEAAEESLLRPRPRALRSTDH